MGLEKLTEFVLLDLMQVATYKILSMQRRFLLKVVDSSWDFVAQTFSLRPRGHNLKDYATKMSKKNGN